MTWLIFYGKCRYKYIMYKYIIYTTYTWIPLKFGEVTKKTKDHQMGVSENGGFSPNHPFQ